MKIRPDCKFLQNFRRRSAPADFEINSTKLVPGPRRSARCPLTAVCLCVRASPISPGDVCSIYSFIRSGESKGQTGGGGVAERGRGERRDRGRSDRRENDESRKTAGWHEGCSENRRQTAKRDRKRQTPKGGRRLAPHSPLLKSPAFGSGLGTPTSRST